MLARPSAYRAASGFIASIAGPSRQPINPHFLPCFQFRSASTAPPPPSRSAPRSRPAPATPATPATPFAPRPIAKLSPSSPTVAATTATPSRQPAWPWRPSPNPPAGYTESERTIYARPFEGPLGNRVRMLWFLVPFWGLVVGFYLTTPSPPPTVKEGEDGVEVVKETPGSVLWNYTTPVLMFTTSTICFLWLVSPSRFVTRLTQVRRQAIASASSSASAPITAGTLAAPIAEVSAPKSGKAVRQGEFIRMQHGGHLMCWGEMEKGREVAMGDMQISLIAGQVRSPYLSLRVRPTKKVSFDSVAYRLDFRDTPVVKATEDEVVLSLSRIESVFGKLE